MRELLEVETIRLSNGHPARLARVSESLDARRIVNALELPTPRALLIINGGTAKLDAQIAASLDKLFMGLAGTVVEERVTVITGATNAGIFSLFGRALEKTGRRLSAPCVGITAAGCVELEDLEPHHSHFVLVEVDEWKLATPAMYRLAETLASDCPSLALFAGGGQVTLTEMQANARQGREMILIEGSKGLADEVAVTYSGEVTARPEIIQIREQGKAKIFPIDQSTSALTQLVKDLLRLD